MEIIINGENAVLGRLASYAAKKALLGNEVIIVNSEKAIITGKESNTLKEHNRKKALGGSGLAGPFISHLSEKILKRTIRNMLPYKKGKGREAFKRIKCYSGIPKEFEDKKMIKSGKGSKGMSLEKLSQMLTK